ncbi:MAG: nuA3 HAT complex component nto1 [Caeruleum heppii]|nr:MAG: nuA3 HAT complex component nto1 [Caeruleum heppii]
MVGIPTTPQRNQSSRASAGSRGRPRARSIASALSHGSPFDPALSSQRERRYVPGGPGGGGRYVDPDGTEVPVGGTGPGGFAYTGPRVRPVRERPLADISPQSYPRRGERMAARPRYSSAAAAAAAAVQGDGYKPREERGWEEFHPDLDPDATFLVFSADEVDGNVSVAQTPRSPAQTRRSEDGKDHSLPNGVHTIDSFEGVACATTPKGAPLGVDQEGWRSMGPNTDEALDGGDIVFTQPKKRRVGRPFRRQDSMLNGLTPLSGPKIVPPPGPNLREKLTLPKPSFRRTDPFLFFEQKGTGQQRYVDRTMANVGYQESDIFLRPETLMIRVAEGSLEEDLDLGPSFKTDGENNTALGGSGVGRVEYDMDEQDDKWLAMYNATRKTLEVEPITREVFEITMTKIEKEWHALEKRIPKPNPKPPQTHRPRSSSAAAVNGEAAGAAGEEQDSKCAICDDGDCENTNAIVFCDGCDLAVHQDCYGVPFIPEGQWLCRKCQLIGRGTPTCIFCPNIDGAFKQTNSSRWSHLLCAIWIPEVTLGNPTFMEPVMDVEKVPKQRWKLTCYICRQRMGACIQCGNKQCFVAFHATCARRARLFLKMKSAHGGPATIDASVLKAYCDKHVPPDWRRENDVDAATADAQNFYRHTMRRRLWADSQQAALSFGSSQPTAAMDSVPDPSRPPLPRLSISLGNNKRKRPQPPKSIWKLPSGAPVIPQIVYNSVESSLQRFMIRKRKEYAAEACKYWTLKREARRGAALLKRLQLSMETFSSMEITRRNFAGMGAAGRARLQRRIDFATTLLKDVEQLRSLCEEVKSREREKLREAEMLRDVVDTVYFPLSPLLWPIIEKAQALDGKAVFRDGLLGLRLKLEQRYYTSVATFSEDFGAVLSSAIGSDPTADPAGAFHPTVDGTPFIDFKERRRLAKRIIKAVQGALEEATRKEAELGRKPFAKELKDLDRLLDSGVFSRRESLAGSLVDASTDARHPETTDLVSQESLSNGDQRLPNHANGVEAKQQLTNGVQDDRIGSKHATRPSSMTDNEIGELHRETLPATDEAELEVAEGITGAGPGPESEGVIVNGDSKPQQPDYTSSNSHRGQQFPTPPLSSEENLLAPLSFGGIPWYLEPFDPIGTTIQEERWTGREVVRGMSEELSEIDEDELKGLVDGDMEVDETAGAANGTLAADVLAAEEDVAASKAKAKKAKARRRWRGYR